MLAATGALFGQQTQSLDEAAADFEQGHVAEAGQKLDTILRSHPDDLRALILKGAVLDSLQRFSEAEQYYQRALKLAPGSAQVLNNAGNHYLASGDRRLARALFLKAVAADPNQVNANLQLAQMDVDNKLGREALGHLNRLGSAANSDPSVALLRARALAQTGRCSDAGPLLGKLESTEGAGASLFVSAGLTFAECNEYQKAEDSFSRALDVDPTNFEILYNLGRAALEAGHAGRATAVLEAALKERPEDVGCLIAAAQAYLKQQRPLDAAARLAQAQKLAPERSDVLLMLAQVTAQLQFFADAVTAYDEYLKLKPADDVARRERSFALVCGNQFKTALPNLEAYVRRHPRDARGFYEMAIAQSYEDRVKALRSLDRALELDPELIEARYSRALLNIEEEKPAAGVDDLRSFLERKPNDPRALAYLGKAYLALDRPSEAADVLKRALVLDPADALALVQYRRALIKLGRAQEAQLVLSGLKEVGSSAGGAKPRAGLIDYLSLSPAAQHARYLENLRSNAAANPGDAQWKMRLGQELLAGGNSAEGLDALRGVKSLSPDSEVLSRCGRILLDFNQYAAAREFLEPAVTRDPSLSAARLDLATVRFHLQGPEPALDELEKIPASGRQGDYYLLRAQVLDSLGRVPEAAEALNHGIAAAPTRPGLYLQAAGFLLKHKLNHEAEDLLVQASRVLPDERELLLARVVTLELLRREVDAQKLLANIQARWPEWDRPYLLNGILLEIQLKSAEARQTLETAIALGAETAEAYYYLALAIMHAAPKALDSAQNAVSHALLLTSTDPYIYLLAGKISVARKDYRAAVDRLTEAVRLQPTLIPAHYALREAYKALGDEQKSATELDTIKQIASHGDVSEQSPLSLGDFLFTVRPPG